jgi:hypothetical protein
MGILQIIATIVTGCVLLIMIVMGIRCRKHLWKSPPGITDRSPGNW